MILIPKSYLRVLRRRDFLILTLTIFASQLAMAFFLLSMVVSVFAQTKNTFGVSGVILSFTVPSFLLMAFAGLAADIFDRRKIMIFSNALIIWIVLFLILSSVTFAAVIPLSFLYFVGNTFFVPASSAASAQLVRKDQLLTANSIFFFAVAGGSVLGLILASIIHFFFGNIVPLLICEVFLVLAIFFSIFLPPLIPHKARGTTTLYKKIKDIWRGFIYIFRQKAIWFFFLSFASAQGVISFGVTLAPGFFERVADLPIEKSPTFILPLIGVGVLCGVMFMHEQRLKESFFVSLGLGLMGLSTLVLAMILNFKWIQGNLLYIPLSLYLFFLGFGEIISMIASRTVLQKRVSHRYQGTVFGAVMILSAFLAVVFSPAAATFEVLLGYTNTLILAGFGFLIFVSVFAFSAKKWNF